MVEETARKRITITGVPKAQPKPKEESLLDVNVDQQDLASEFLNGSSQNNANSIDNGSSDTADLLGGLTIENSNTNQATLGPIHVWPAPIELLATKYLKKTAILQVVLMTFGDLTAPMTPTLALKEVTACKGKF